MSLSRKALPLAVSAFAKLLQAADTPAPPIVAIAEDTTPQRPCERDCLNPVEAVTYASYVGQKAGIAGDFEMPVRNVGKERGMYFLNSERDYRDRNCLTIAVPAAIAEKLAGSQDRDQVERFFTGRQIVVRGIARQVRIDFLDPARRPTGKFYYQVQIRVQQPDQVNLLA